MRVFKSQLKQRNWDLGLPRMESWTNKIGICPRGKTKNMAHNKQNGWFCHPNLQLYCFYPPREGTLGCRGQDWRFVKFEIWLVVYEVEAATVPRPDHLGNEVLVKNWGLAVNKRNIDDQLIKPKRCKGSNRDVINVWLQSADYHRHDSWYRHVHIAMTCNKNTHYGNTTSTTETLLAMSTKYDPKETVAKHAYIYNNDSGGYNPKHTLSTVGIWTINMFFVD